MRPVVTDRVAWSVGLSVTVVSRAKTAELTEMSFGLWTRVGLRNHVIDRSPDRPVLSGNFWGEGHASRLVTPHGGKCTRPPPALWWHYCLRRTSAFVTTRADGGWRIWFSRLCAAARRPFVKLLRPLVISTRLSGLMITYFQCKRSQGWISLQVVMYIITAAAIYSLGHGLHTLPSVPNISFQTE